MRRVSISLLALSLFSLPALASPPVVQTYSDWGNLEEVREYGQFYVSGAVDEPALAQFKAVGGAVVIDLRAANEMDCGMRNKGAALGLKYLNLPLDKSQDISPELISAVVKAIDEAAGKPVWINCQTGNRAAAVLTAYLVRSGKLSSEDAMPEARSLGLKAKVTQDKLAKYLQASR